MVIQKLSVTTSPQEITLIAGHNHVSSVGGAVNFGDNSGVSYGTGVTSIPPDLVCAAPTSVWVVANSTGEIHVVQYY